MKRGSLLGCLAIIFGTMDSFKDIPALGDSITDDEVEEEEEGLDEDVKETDSDGKYRFNGKHIYVTWSKSTIESILPILGL